MSWDMQNGKVVFGMKLASLATASGSGIAVDCLEYRYAIVDYLLGDCATNPTELKLTECDTSGGSYTDVTGSIGDTDFTIPAADGSNNQCVRFVVDLCGKKRYLKPAVTTGGTQVCGVTVNLVNPAVGPTTDALQGCTEIVYL